MQLRPGLSPRPGLMLLVGAGLLSRDGEVRVTLEPLDAGSDREHLQQQLAAMNPDAFPGSERPGASRSYP